MAGEDLNPHAQKLNPIDRKYAKLQQLHKNSWMTWYYGIHVSTGKEVVLHAIKTNSIDEDNFGPFSHELKVLNILRNCEKFITIHDAWFTHQNEHNHNSGIVYLVTDYHCGEPLRNYIKHGKQDR